MKLGTKQQAAARLRHALLGCLLAALAWSAAAMAEASTVVIVPPHVERGVSGEASEQAVEEISRLVRAHGFDTVSPGQAEAAAESAQKSGAFPSDLSVQECLTPECATEYRRLFDAAFAVQLSLFAEGKKVSSVAVVIAEDAKAYFGANAEVQGDDVRAAVQAAYAAARERHLRGAGPWLTITGGPAGAVVYLDGSEFGTLPIQRRHLEAGMHRLEIRQDRFATHKQVLNVPPRVDHEETLRITLMPVGTTGEPVAAHRPLDRTWDYVLGGALLAAGAAHVGMGAYQKSIRDDCAERSGDACLERYGDRTGVKRENLLLGLGAASMVLGGGVMWFAPIARLQVRAQRDAASISVEGAF